jgi:hypothetical protein
MVEIWEDKMRSFLLLAVLSLTGCSGLALIHAVDRGDALTPEQIKAYKEMNQAVYGCFQIGGPPPAGNTVWIVVPANSPINFKFGDNCHVIQ